MTNTAQCNFELWVMLSFRVAILALKKDDTWGLRLQVAQFKLWDWSSEIGDWRLGDWRLEIGVACFQNFWQGYGNFFLKFTYEEMRLGVFDCKWRNSNCEIGVARLEIGDCEIGDCEIGVACSRGHSSFSLPTFNLLLLSQVGYCTNNRPHVDLKLPTSPGSLYFFFPPVVTWKLISGC